MNLIAAVDEHWALGKDGDQLVYLSQDLKRFKALTTGHPVILGRKTMATFPGGRPLKGRRNLILSRNPDFAPEGAEVFPDLDSLLAKAPGCLRHRRRIGVSGPAGQMRHGLYHQDPQGLSRRLLAARLGCRPKLEPGGGVGAFGGEWPDIQLRNV